MSYLEAGATLGISDETAIWYQIYYENISGILHQHGTKNFSKNSEFNNTINPKPLSSMCNYMDIWNNGIMK